MAIPNNDLPPINWKNSIDTNATSRNPLGPWAVSADSYWGSPSASISPFISHPNVATHVIRGEMLVAKLTMREDLFLSDTVQKDEIKERLAMDLAEQLLASKYIEFTQRSGLDRIFTARVFVTPDAQTQMIRELQSK